jgi:succinoglycan biosynthesis protein ExoL
MARNLEMLVLAAAAKLWSRSKAPLVYECLDIHDLMSQGHGAGGLLRLVERGLLKGCAALMVSSPGFVREYFAKQIDRLPKVILVENKVAADADLIARIPDNGLASRPPWRIGWFGVIRCRRSLELLRGLVRRNPGLVEVVIAGRAAVDQVGDLAVDLANEPGMHFHGRFADEAELASLFRGCHYAWVMDFYQSGANSDWLLPNRLYRACWYGAVPIVDGRVETGRWTADHAAGVVLDDVTDARLDALVQGLTPADYDAAKAALSAIPTAALISDDSDCRDLVAQLEALTGRGAPGSEPGWRPAVRMEPSA